MGCRGMVPSSGEVLADSTAPRAWEGSAGRWRGGPDWNKSMGAGPAYAGGLLCACSWGQLDRIPSQKRM